MGQNPDNPCSPTPRIRTALDQACYNHRAGRGFHRKLGFALFLLPLTQKEVQTGQLILPKK